MKIKENNQNKEKFLCYCSKVTYKKFKQEVFSSNFTDLENLCTGLKLANQCAACLPNIEDEFFQIKGNRHKIKKVLYSKEKNNLIERLKNYIDALSGNKLVSQNGHLPMLVSSNIKTWLVVSNEAPSFMSKKAVAYKINLLIFSNEGKKIKQISNLIKPNNSLKICLNNFVPKTKDISTYYVKVTRIPIAKGFRGSTRPHFYYETENSMATLHTQDGQIKKNYINLTLNKSNDRYFVFMINPNNKIANVKSNVEHSLSESKVSIPPRGSCLIEVKEKEQLNNFIFKSISNNPIKCYFIIADKALKNLSVDHI